MLKINLGGLGATMLKSVAVNLPFAGGIAAGATCCAVVVKKTISSIADNSTKRRFLAALAKSGVSNDTLVWFSAFNGCVTTEAFRLLMVGDIDDNAKMSLRAALAASL